MEDEFAPLNLNNKIRTIEIIEEEIDTITE
jgi:hypothetical protein